MPPQLTVTLRPFSLVAVPIVAVACTTALTVGELAGGVTRNVAVIAWPGWTVPKVVRLVAASRQPCGSWTASRTPCSVWFPPAVSVTCAVKAFPGVTADGAVNATCRAPGVAVTANDPRSGRFASAEESPT